MKDVCKIVILLIFLIGIVLYVGDNQLYDLKSNGKSSIEIPINNTPYAGVSYTLMNIMIEEDKEILGSPTANIENGDVPTVSSSMTPKQYIADEVLSQQKIIEEEQERIRLEQEAIQQAEIERIAQINSITADPNDISKVSNLTYDQYFILTKDTWWEGREQILIDLEKYYGINAFYAMSVSTLESGHGTSDRAKLKHNYYGAEVPTYFEGLYDNTMYFGDFQSRLYVDKGIVSVWAIGPIYCPPNRNWEIYMATHMKELYNKVISTLN